MKYRLLTISEIAFFAAQGGSCLMVTISLTLLGRRPASSTRSCAAPTSARFRFSKRRRSSSSQPQDRQDPRPDHPAIAAGAGRPSHRVWLAFKAFFRYWPTMMWWHAVISNVVYVATMVLYLRSACELCGHNMLRHYGMLAPCTTCTNPS
jgi:hypothetical protein